MYREEDRQSPRCGICANTLVKNGTTTAGRTWWRCTSCGGSITQPRPDITAKAQFSMWLDWLLSASPQRELPVARSTFCDSTAWCWKVMPQTESTGEIHQWIMLDSTYYQDMCVLIAATQSHVVDWQFCDREKTVAWEALLAKIPAPDIAIIDGQRGLLSALGKILPETKIQR